MKKILLGLLGLIFLFCFSISAAPVAAQEENASESSSPAAKVEYTLAYPGILPDNPLHFLKATRDKLVSFLISDPLKKAEFNLLTSDKRINAAWILSVRGKDELAVSTLSKSNNYLDQAVTAVISAKNSGRNVDTVLHNLKNAILKHEETLISIKEEVNKSFSAQLQSEESRLKSFGKSINKLLPQ